MANQSPSRCIDQSLEDWGAEAPETTSSSGDTPEYWGEEKRGPKVTGAQKLKLAKMTLGTMGVGYLALCVTVLFVDPEMVSEVWRITTYLVNNLLVLTLGYYFGRHPP